MVENSTANGYVRYINFMNSSADRPAASGSLAGDTNEAGTAPCALGPVASNKHEQYYDQKIDAIAVLE
jgi:hypothetical protein